MATLRALVVKDGAGGVDDGGSAIAAVRRLAARLPKSLPPTCRTVSSIRFLQWIDRQLN